MIHLRIVISAIILQAAYGYIFGKCAPIAKRELNIAAQFISTNLKRINEDFGDILSDSFRTKFLKKWSSLVILCADNAGDGGGNLCLDKPLHEGYTFVNNKKSINICYYNLVTNGASICHLVDLIVHEYAHAHGFPVLPGHNAPDEMLLAKDPVYQMGFRAADLCDADSSIRDRKVKGKVSLTKGSKCYKDDQCISQRCRVSKCA